MGVKRWVEVCEILEDRVRDGILEDWEGLKNWPDKGGGRKCRAKY